MASSFICFLCDAETQLETQMPSKKTCVTFKVDDVVLGNTSDTSDNDFDAEDELESTCSFDLLSTINVETYCNSLFDRI